MLACVHGLWQAWGTHEKYFVYNTKKLNIAKGITGLHKSQACQGLTLTGMQEIKNRVLLRLSTVHVLYSWVTTANADTWEYEGGFLCQKVEAEDRFDQAPDIALS